MYSTLSANPNRMFFSSSLENGTSFSNPLWLCNATNLRQLANEFSNSPLRIQVRNQAQSVDLATLNAQTFGEMIQEVFSVSDQILYPNYFFFKSLFFKIV